MKNTKGQITIFIIVGILVLMMFGALMYVTGYGGRFFGGDQANEVTNYVQDCAAQVFEDGLILLGQQGGRINLQSPYHEELKSSILLKNKTKFVPSVDEVERELNSYLEENIGGCLDFSVIQGRTLIDQGAFIAKTTIGKKDISVVIDYPLKFRRGDDIENINNYLVVKKIGFLKFLRVVNRIIDFQLVNNYMIPDNPMQNGDELQFRITSYDNHVVMSIKDEDYRIGNKPYEFVFMEKY